MSRAHIAHRSSRSASVLPLLPHCTSITLQSIISGRQCSAAWIVLASLGISVDAAGHRRANHREVEGRTTWPRKIADLHRWIAPSSARLPARAARLPTRRAPLTSGRAKKRGTPAARVACESPASPRAVAGPDSGLTETSHATAERTAADPRVESGVRSRRPQTAPGSRPPAPRHWRSRADADRSVRTLRPPAHPRPSAPVQLLERLGPS